MSREALNKYFDKLTELYDENDFYTKPGHIFNMDETGCHLKIHPGIVIATKDAKDVHSLTCAEKEEKCGSDRLHQCRRSEVALAPALILKGVRENPSTIIRVPIWF